MKEIYVVTSSNSNDGVVVLKSFTEKEKAVKCFEQFKKDLLDCMTDTKAFFKIACNDDECFWIMTADSNTDYYVQLSETELFEDGE